MLFRRASSHGEPGAKGQVIGPAHGKGPARDHLYRRVTKMWSIWLWAPQLG